MKDFVSVGHLSNFEYRPKNSNTGVYQLLFWINFWGCPGNLNITVTRLWPRFESYHGIFFPYTFFIHFIKFSSAVELSSSIQNFSPIKFFLKEFFNIFGFWKPFENFFSQVLPIYNYNNWYTPVLSSSQKYPCIKKQLTAF
jgi:hypothetical protein